MVPTILKVLADGKEPDPDAASAYPLNPDEKNVPAATHRGSPHENNPETRVPPCHQDRTSAVDRLLHSSALSSILSVHNPALLIDFGIPTQWDRLLVPHTIVNIKD